MSAYSTRFSSDRGTSGIMFDGPPERHIFGARVYAVHERLPLAGLAPLCMYAPRIFPMGDDLSAGNGDPLAGVLEGIL